MTYLEILKNMVVPSPVLTLEEQIIPLTRNALLLIWMFLYLICGGKKYHRLFFIVSSLAILIMYYIKYYHIHIQRTSMIENYCEPVNPNRITKLQHCEAQQCDPIAGVTQIPIDQWSLLPKGNALRIENPSQYRFCQDNRPTGRDQSFYSSNQALAGPPNPKTMAPVPVIAPPMAWDYWSENFVVPQGINDQTHFDLLGSGYASLSQCGETSDLVYHPANQPNPNPPVENKVPPGFYPTPKNDTIYEPINNGQVVEGFNTLYPGPNLKQAPEQQHHWINSKGTPGDVLGCGYNPKQLLDHNIPSNVPTGECAREDAFNDYNKNLYTSVIQPGMYSRTEVVEPIQSNMGITFQQQYQPVTCQPAPNGGTTYITHDPRIIPPIKTIPKPPVQPDNSNIYDPRSFGYGTSYRSYIDTMTGQPRFMYDDIDVVRKPNYITRSNVDDAEWAHSYGIINNEKTDGPIPNTYSRALAQNKFLQDSLKQRGELQERYAHKYNTERSWQLRQAPIHRRGGQTNTCNR